MHNDRKPGIRIIAERVSVTTIRFRAKALYCDKCRRPLEADQIDLATVDSEPQNTAGAAAIASAPENEIGENK